ncbi:unnamed protein product, partial [Nesidiocoris tenuis]
MFYAMEWAENRNTAFSTGRRKILNQCRKSENIFCSYCRSSGEKRLSRLTHHLREEINESTRFQLTCNKKFKNMVIKFK